ncbi:MAG: FAD-dependent oxidoreductase [Proteobacteria bacterium]|nr:FAD-dependent oxidoreductase [Pseudomonadota bacterium]
MTKHIVVIGGVALGTKAACRLKRLSPDTEVTLLDKDEKISYGGCGIPYYVSGDVAEAEDLQSTAFHMVRDAEFFRKIKGFKVLTGTEAICIDRENKRVFAKNAKGERLELPYDKLVLGTGSRPRNLNIPGQDLENIYSVGNLVDAIRIKDLIAKGNIGKAVIVGAGFIGLEMAEAFTDMWGIETSVVEVSDRIMPGNVSRPMARMAMKTMEDNGVSFYLNERVLRFEGNGPVERVVTDKQTLDADIVIMAVGIQANSELAKDTGLEVGVTGGIVVNSRLETSDPDIYAGGDCVQVPNLVDGEPGFYPLGSIANRHGRIIGTNLAGGQASIEGALGSFVVKLFDSSLAGTGLTLAMAQKSGFDAVSVRMGQLDRAHFYPEKDFMFFELVVERKTKRILGIQGFGTSGDAMVGRINTVAAILKYKPLLEDISNLEFAYSPPFSSAMDIVNALANVAENALDGHLKVIDHESVEALWLNDENSDSYFLDCREQLDAAPLLEKYPGRWHNIPQGELKDRIAEVPRDKNIILVCNSGMRSYEAQLNLRNLGIYKTQSVEGGMKMLKTWGSEI